LCEAGNHVGEKVANPFDAFHVSEEEFHRGEEFGNALGLVGFHDLFQLPEGDQMYGQDFDIG